MLSDTTSIIKPEILEQAKIRGISEETLHAQLATFRRGVQYASVDRACTIADGIVQLKNEDYARLLEAYSRGARDNRLSKFVPASGAASRMFKFLQTLAARPEPLTLKNLKEQATAGDSDAAAGIQFFTNFERFAFAGIVKNTFTDKAGAFNDLDKWDDLRPLLHHILTERGHNYSQLPKGLIPFHHSDVVPRTPFEEHLAEAAAHLADGDGILRVHFTVPEQYLSLVREHVNSVALKYRKPGLSFEVVYSVQKPDTDTIAVTPENEPFLTTDGQLLFRPAGHGALLDNLQDTCGDIVFIKNIDNVVPDQLKPTTILFKKLLAGYLIDLQTRVFDYLKLLESHTLTGSKLGEIIDFMSEKLSIECPLFLKDGSEDKLREFLFAKLNRPFRVCGMVRNVGEPGGGPFWVRGKDGTLSLQIIESSQIDPNSSEQVGIFRSATHFNPVDLVCAIRDYKGQQFELTRFRDPDSGFISIKSYGGRELKALELPGLWNGAMADWITVFVEVPLLTFNPVKTVNDLLRREHQPV